MSFENGMSIADAAALAGNNRGGMGGWGNDGFGGWWVILFILLAMGGNWGNGGYGGGGAVPYIGAQADMQRGFDQQATIGAISNLQTQIGSGFADAAVARCAGDASLTQAITNGQYATAQAITGAKDTIATGMNQLAMSLQNCCCENRAGLADLKYTVATENCADRQAISDGLRDLMAQNTANTNAIIQSQQQGFQNVQDKLCQLELDGYKQRLDASLRENASLQNALNMANMRESQTAQTAAILANNEAQTANLIQRLNPTPIPAYPVQNPNCCTPNFGYGCGAA